MSSTKVELRMTYCCCCSLTVATILIGIYSIIVYGVFLGLAASSVSRIVTDVKDPGYEPQSYVAETVLLSSSQRNTTVPPEGYVVVEVSNYYYSLGLYSELMVFRDMKGGPTPMTQARARSIRLPVLAFSIAVFVLLLISTILLFVSLCTDVGWFLIPWFGTMVIDILRGTIICILIFCWCEGNIRQIAVGIFFLGLQLFHMSLLFIVFAKFQRVQNKEKGIEYRIERTGDKSILVEGSNPYPTLPSQYAYSASPHYRREGGFYQPNYYNGPEGRPTSNDRNQQAQYYRSDQSGPTSSMPRGQGKM